MPFGNPIVGGNVLVRPSIQSPDYVTGVSGWAILRDGTAEFNDAEFRGPITAVGTNGSYVVLGVESDTGRPSLRFFDNTNTMKAYLIWDQTTDSFQMTGIDSGTLRMTATGIRLQGDGANPLGIFFDPADGYIKHWDTAAGASDWHAITYQNGWSTRGGFFNVGYKVMADGIVMLRGAAVGGTNASGTVIGTLPVGIRPSSTEICPLVCAPGVAGSPTPSLQINTSGTLQIFDATSATSIGVGGCKFPLV